MINKIFDWIKANWFLTLIGTIGIIFFIPPSTFSDLVQVIFLTVLLEQLSLILYKNTIVFVMNDEKLKPFFAGKDGILEGQETLGLTIFQTGGLVSARILVATVALGVYFAV